MSGSRFVYILFLIFMAFGTGSLAIHNWGKIKSFLPKNLAATSEDVGREAVSVIGKMKSGARDIAFGKTGAAKKITSPIGGAPGTVSSNLSKSPGGPRFSSLHLSREPGSRFSGNGKPGWNVTVEGNGRPLGRTKVNRLGSWELIVPEALRENDYKFGLVARGPGSIGKIERGEGAIIKFKPSDGDSKVVIFSHSGIGAVTVPRVAPVISKPVLDGPEVQENKVAALANDKSVTSDTDDIQITDAIRKKASELGRAASEEFTRALNSLKPKADDDSKIALGPDATASKVAPKVSPKVTPKVAQKVAPKVAPKVAQKVAPKVAQKVAPKVAPITATPPEGGDDMSVDKALDKAGELASDAKKGIIGYLDKLGLSGKPDTDEAKKPDVKKPMIKKTVVKKPAVKKVVADLVFDKVDMTDGKGQTGQLTLSGRAQPNSIIGIFIGQRSIASVIADASGRWSFSGLRNIPYGNNVVGAVQRDINGKILGRSEYSLKRVAPKTIVALNKPIPDVGKPKGSEVIGKPATGASLVKSKRDGKTLTTSKPQTTAKPSGKAVAKAKSRYRSAKYRKKKRRLARAKKRGKKYRRKYSRKHSRKHSRKYRRKYRARMGLGAKSAIPKRVRKYRKRNSKCRKTQRSAPCKRGFKRYRVRKGDSLWKISKKFFGTGKRHSRIYRLNKKRIRNPNRIYPSQRICIGRR